MESISIVLSRGEMRLLYQILKNGAVARYSVDRYTKNQCSHWLSSMEEIYNTKRCDEFVLVFKGFEITTLAEIISYERFDDTRDKAIGMGILDFIKGSFKRAPTPTPWVERAPTPWENFFTYVSDFPIKY